MSSSIVPRQGRGSQVHQCPECGFSPTPGDRVTIHHIPATAVYPEGYILTSGSHWRYTAYDRKSGFTGWAPVRDDTLRLIRSGHPETVLVVS